jgi:hypothetical protein
MKHINNEFLRDVFTCALEGGIGYWSVAHRYMWEPKKFIAVITEIEDAYGAEGTKKFKVNAAVIRKGIELLMAGTVHVNTTIAATLKDAVATGDTCMIDAEVADCIVQAGLFGEIVYG